MQESEILKAFLASRRTSDMLLAYCAEFLRRQRVASRARVCAVLLFVLLGPSSQGCESRIDIDASAYTVLSPRIIPLDFPTADEGSGSLITTDVNGDGLRDFIVTKANHIAVYDHSGDKLWTKFVNIQVTGHPNENGLPGWHGPGVQAADIDGDGRAEVLYLTTDGALHINDGLAGSRSGGKCCKRPPVRSVGSTWS